MSTVTYDPSMTRCLSYPQKDHSECPSSVECFHADIPKASPVVLVGEKDSMQAYVSEKAPHMGVFRYFGAPKAA